MKLSRRASRMQRHYRRRRLGGGLNLVSLMDIFTILVFFLMVNSSDVKVLENTKQVKLPVSTAEQVPGNALVVMVSGPDVLVQGRKVASIDDEPTSRVLTGLRSELDYQATRLVASPTGGRAVTVMADRELPYQQLSRVMKTCVEAGFNEVALAVSKLQAKGGGA